MQGGKRGSQPRGNKDNMDPRDSLNASQDEERTKEWNQEEKQSNRGGLSPAVLEAASPKKWEKKAK